MYLPGNRAGHLSVEMWPSFRRQGSIRPLQFGQDTLIHVILSSSPVTMAFGVSL